MITDARRDEMRRIAKRARKVNPIIFTGRTRRRWFFWTQYEYEGPVYVARWQNPYNVDRWPRAKYWLYAAPRVKS